MPVFDPIRRCLVARVVYDGPAFGGKTTNLQQINAFFPVERRSELFTPAALKGRTMFFDWLEIQAGKVGAYPLRIQLLTVPGQGERSYRRRPLLESADGVVFVCDSSFVHLPIAKKSYSQLRAALRKRLPRVIPVLIQANKQDKEDALPPEELGLALRVPSGVQVFGAKAAAGEGVKDMLVAAIRAVAVEVQQQIAEGKIHQIMGQSQTADELFEVMLALEDEDEHELMESDEEYDASVVDN
jgi:signal recognition particle receptor subunit beta